MNLLYLGNIWYVYGSHSYRFSQDFPDFVGFKQQSYCSYKEKGFQNLATWHIAPSGKRAGGLVARNTNTS